MTYPTEDYAYVFGAALLECLTTAATGLPNPPGQFCYRAGTEIVHDIDLNEDLCCEGIGYVTLGDTWPSSASFPEQDIVRQANAKCAPPAWGQTYKAGIIRCIPVMTDELGSMPTCTDWTAAYMQNVSDSIALRRAACCFRRFVTDQQTDLLGMSIVIERQVQGAALGGCIERTLSISVQFPTCDCG